MASLEYCESVVEVQVLTPLIVWTGKTSILGLDSFTAQRGDGMFILVAGEDCIEAAVRSLLARYRINHLADVERVLPGEIKRLLEAGRCQAEIEAEITATVKEGEAILLGWKYPPETSIKGLLRTAILTQILSEELRGHNQQVTLNDIRDAVNSLLKGTKPKDAARGLEEARFKLQVPISNFKYDVFQRINLTFEGWEDTGMILDIFDVKEKGGGLVASLNVVAIRPGSKFRYTLLITRLSRNVPGRASRGPAAVLQRLHDLDAKVASCERIRDSLNLYSKLLLESEDAKYRYLGLPELSRFTEDLRMRLERIGGGLPLKLGLKAGHDSKTVAPLLKTPQAAGIPSALHGQLRSLYQNLTQTLSAIYRKVWDDRTVTISRYTGEPVGWVAVRIVG